MANNNYPLAALFTDEEIKLAVEFYNNPHYGRFIDLCVDRIVKPALPRINKLTGQENDPRYLAYALEYVMVTATTRK